MTELDTLFRKLYEDNALGRLTDERFVFLTSGYEDEKKSCRKDRRVTTADRNRYRAKKGYIKVYSDCREIQRHTGIDL